MYNFIKHITLNEGHTPKSLKQTELSYRKDSLDPAVSEDTMKYHYGKLYKGYVERYNNGEGDQDFNEAGAFLHSIYFTQFGPYTSTNSPSGFILDFIEKHFKTWDLFKEKFQKTAMGLQGSGWVYLARNGEIKTITNHQIKHDIVILVDWWEHAWALDYQADKKKYLENQWKVMDWAILNGRVPTAG